MGLDAVELIMEIEDAFDIRIPDNQASRVITVGDLFDYIVELKRDTVSSRNVCLSAATFYRIRRAVCAELELNRKAVRPGITLESTFPQVFRRPFWTRLQTALNLKLPHLARPKWLVETVAGVSIAVSAWIGFIGFRIFGPGAAAFAFIATLFLTGMIAETITSPFATQFRPAFATYRDLSHVVLAHNYTALSREYNSWNTTDAWDALKLIIVEQLGVKPEVVTRDASLVSDLGMG